MARSNLRSRVSGRRCVLLGTEERMRKVDRADAGSPASSVNSQISCDATFLDHEDASLSIAFSRTRIPCTKFFASALS